MYCTKKTRVLRIEARRRPAAAIAVDRSPFRPTLASAAAASGSTTRPTAIPKKT